MTSEDRDYMESAAFIQSAIKSCTKAMRHLVGGEEATKQYQNEMAQSELRMAKGAIEEAIDSLESDR